MSMYNILFLFQISVISFCLSQDHVVGDTKRLLLNDPAVIQAQIHALESKLQDMTAKQHDSLTLLHDVTARVNTLEQENLKLKADITKLETINSEIRKSKGASYIRWGRNDCQSLNGTELVYSGLVGGGSYTEKGSGVNYLCLPHDPDQPKLMSNIVPEASGWYGHVFGAEYQFSYSNVKIDDDVPCVACLDKHATTKIMIPGKTTCPTAWRKQYEGFLCSTRYDQASSEFECLDINPQYIDGGRPNHNGKLLYPVVAMCGSLQCPPYETGKYVSCVVCTI